MENYHFIEYCRIHAELLKTRKYWGKTVEYYESDEYGDLERHWDACDRKEREFLNEWSVQWAETAEWEKRALQMQDKLKEIDHV